MGRRMATMLIMMGAAIVALHIVAAAPERAKLPPWVDCTSNSDCVSGYCCMIGHERYSYPNCRRLRGEGELCRPGGPLVTNGSRHYPDGLEIVLGEVYVMLCPCADGLTCERNEDAVCGSARPATAAARPRNWDRLLQDKHMTSRTRKGGEGS